MSCFLWKWAEVSHFPAEVKKKLIQKAEYFDCLCSVFYASNKTDGMARHSWRCMCFCLWWCPTLSDLYSAGRGLAQEVTSSDIVSPPVCGVRWPPDTALQHIAKYHKLWGDNWEVTVIFIILTVKPQLKTNVMCRSRGFTQTTVYKHDADVDEWSRNKFLLALN